MRLPGGLIMPVFSGFCPHCGKPVTFQEGNGEEEKGFRVTDAEMDEYVRLLSEGIGSRTVAKRMGINARRMETIRYALQRRKMRGNP